MIKINIPADVLEIFSVIEEYGADAYVVGGCVRDSILGLTPHDWDICTPVLASELYEMFKEKGYKVYDTGLKHGTITVNLNGENYEITQFRREGKYTDGRYPDTVEFTSDLIEDLSRRDFTMNAIAYHPEEGIIDPFCGVDDIKKRIVRCVGNPYERFTEDALRILRAIRFAAHYIFLIDSNTSEAIHKLKDLISNISIERINSEFCKIMEAKLNCVVLSKYYDVISEFIPEILNMVNFEQNNPYHIADVYEHTMIALDASKTSDLITNLVVFFHDIGKPCCYQDDENGIRHFKGHGKVSAVITDGIMKRMRFDNDTREKVVQLVYYHDATFEVGEKYVKRWLNKIGEDQFKRLLDIRICDICGQNPEYEEERLKKIDSIQILLDKVLQEHECFSLKDLCVNGNDVKKYMMINEGKDVGMWLQIMLDKVINGEIYNNRDNLIEWMIGVTDGRIDFKC